MKTLDQEEFLHRLDGCLLHVHMPGGPIVFSHDRRGAVHVFASYHSGGCMVLDVIHLAGALNFDELCDTANTWIETERQWCDASEILDR